MQGTCMPLLQPSWPHHDDVIQPLPDRHLLRAGHRQDAGRHGPARRGQLRRVLCDGIQDVAHACATPSEVPGGSTRAEG